MGGIAGLIGFDTKKWNLVAEKAAGLIDDVRAQIVPPASQLFRDLLPVVAGVKELVDIIRDKPTP